MSHQPTSTDFDKFTTYKITGQTVKRTSNESHDDDSKKLKLEKSGSVLTNPGGAACNPAVTQQSTHLLVSNSVIATADLNSKKIKSRMKVNDTSATTIVTTTPPTSVAAGYSLIIEENVATGTGSEESSESSSKTFTGTGGDGELMFIRKHVTSNKSDSGSGSGGNFSGDGSIEERIIHIEGDTHSGNTPASYITAMSTKPPPKRLQIGMAEAKKSLGDSIDLKLITTSEGQSGNKISVMSAEKKSEQILISGSNPSINPQNTFTYSRVCSVSNVSGQTGESVNLKTLQGTVKNQSLMVSSKKLLPEVTQTTAKVSIGNTTISVPLLKPLSSTQIIQTGSGNTGQTGNVDGTKNVIHTIQTGGNPASQTQLSKILNIKRGQKVTQPTFVSFSQLQIKPVPSAKIVQAKVVGKKIPLQIQAVQTNKSTLLQQTSGVVTITSTKADPHNIQQSQQHHQQQTNVQGHIFPSPQKKQQLSFVKEISTGAIIKTTSTANIEDSSAVSISNSNTTNEQITTTAKVMSDSSIKIIDKSSQLIKTNTTGEATNPSIIATEYLPASVKVVHASSSQQHLNSTNLRNTLATQIESLDQNNTGASQQQQPQQQQQRINICPTISIVRQNTPQLVTTSGNLSTVSLSMADAVSGQQKLILTKSQFANVSSANVSTSMAGGNTVTTNFPRNISLMLAKSSASQQVFTTSGSKNTLCVTTAAGNKITGGTRLNLNIQPNVVNSTSVLATSAQNETDSSLGTTSDAGSTETGHINVQVQQQNQSQPQQHQASHITQNRKIIQVLPGLYSSSGGSIVQITKTKPVQEDDEKKKSDVNEQQQQQQNIQQHQKQPQQQVQTQQIHLQIQQQQQQGAQQQQQATQQQQQQQQQNHGHQQQIHMQIQQQQQNQPQQIHIQQQIQNVRQQQLQHHRQQLLHKQQMQQLQKQQQQQHLINQQQQQQQHQSQDLGNSSNNTATSSENHTSEVKIGTSTSSTPNTTKFSLNQMQTSQYANHLLSNSNSNNTTTQANPSADQHQQQPLQQQQQQHSSKTEESNNVLLKQLLQNSNATPNNQNTNSNSRCSVSTAVTAATAVLPARKVINVRAPSLGLVSSLEAQLARPVIPPVPASESSSTPISVSQTPPTITSQSIKLLNDNIKSLSQQQQFQQQQQGASQAPTPPAQLQSTQSNTTISSTNNTTNISSISGSNTSSSLIITTTKSNIAQNIDKPKPSSSPLISKETSFVSKPSLPTQTSLSHREQQHQQQQQQSEQNQNIEIFSLQQTLQSSDNHYKSEKGQQQQQNENISTSSVPGTGQISVGGSGSAGSVSIGNQQSFKQFLQTNTAQGSLTAKITKYVQDVRKSVVEQQQQKQQLQQKLQQQQQQHHQLQQHQQQQQLQQQNQPQQQQQQQHQMASLNRSFSTGTNITNIATLSKDHGNVILSTHANQQHAVVTTSSNSSMNVSVNVTQGQHQQQQFVGTMQQGNLAESNNQTKVIDGQTSTTTQASLQHPPTQQEQKMTHQLQQQQITHQQIQSNQILMQHMQQQQQQHHQTQQNVETKQIIKMEVDETPQYQQAQAQLQQQQQQQLQHKQQLQTQQQQQTLRTSTSLTNTLNTSISTTSTNTVVSATTNEGTVQISMNNKQQQLQSQLIQQQQLQQATQQQQQQQHHHLQQVQQQQQHHQHLQQQQQNQHHQQQTTHANQAITTALNAVSTPATTTASNSANKDAERKKRKRDQQKQRKQIIGTTKDTATISSPSLASTSNAAANAKKRSRKSLKLEEDYDGFIDNLLSHLRQMQPLQVLEPQLNVNYGVCNIYGWRNSNSTSPVKESRQNERFNLFEQELEGEFGAAYLPNKVPFYDSNNFMDLKTKDDSNTTTIQNNYYDQEFTSFTYKTESEKLSSWVKVYKERAVESPEIVTNKLLTPIDPVKTMRLKMLQQETFPGLILMSSTQQKLGRMSPVIPFVNPMALITKRKKSPLKPLENDAAANGLFMKDHEDDLLDNKVGIKNSLNSQNVVLSLPTSSAERLLDVLKHLANLLQLSSPIPYKIVENNSDIEAEANQKMQSSSLTPADREVALKYASIQKILNGSAKMCRQCGKAITGRCIKSNDDSTKTRFHACLVHPTKPRYFCNKICYIQFRWSIEKKPSSIVDLKSVLDSKDNEIFMETSAAAAAVEANKFTKDSNKTSLKSLFYSVQQKEEVRASTTSTNTETKTEDISSTETVTKVKKIPFRYFGPKCFQATTPVKRMSDKEIRDLLFKMDITMSATTHHSNMGEPGTHHPVEDRRQCVLCSQLGDGVADGPSRLLNYDIDKWVHLNCALWSTEVYETISGGLVNFHLALQNGLNQSCNSCQQLGATVKCYKTRCGAVFHLPCAIRDQCVFYQNKTIHCHAHALRNDKDKELMTLSAPRRIYVERDENRQVAAIMHHSEMSNLMRVGSLIFLNVGQLLPHQLEAFHTPNYIYPIGYKVIRFYWSMHRPNKRCRYICSIVDVSGHPEFRIVVQEPAKPDLELRDITPKAVWQRVLQSVAEMRKTHNLVKLYPEFISGEDLFGLTEPSIVRIIESLPGVETLTNYRFKYGRNPLLDLPLALNPSGAARTEPKLRQLIGWKKHHPQRTCSNVNTVSGHHGTIASITSAGEVTCPYSKQFVHSKSSQYKKMKQEWRNNVYLARSKIQGLGLYAARDMERHTMIIEYIGEVIRSEVSECREKQYEARNRGIYMFRLDEDRVVDATLSGGLARYINHSCNPNCVTEIVEVDRELRIIIFAKRRINRGEELSYDYKFDLEDEGSKIPCMCGAPNCRKWMN